MNRRRGLKNHGLVGKSRFGELAGGSTATTAIKKKVKASRTKVWWENQGLVGCSAALLRPRSKTKRVRHPDSRLGVNIQVWVPACILSTCHASKQAMSFLLISHSAHTLYSVFSTDRPATSVIDGTI